MEEMQIVEATERFLRGEMSPEEMLQFRELRKSRPDIDQQVVEYSVFLTELARYGEATSLRSELRQIENELKEKGLIEFQKPVNKITGFLSTRYRETIMVAATVAGIILIIGITIISAINSGSERKIKPLVEKLKQQEKKTSQIEKRMNQLAGSGMPSMEARFRATGFMIDPLQGYLITNAHVVQEARNRIIVENNQGLEYNAQAIYFNTETDLAILKITDSAFKKMPVLPYSIKKKEADLGDAIFLLGYPKPEIVYDEGYISAMNGFDMDTLFYQLSTPANEGNSGSPIINRRGELVGVISSMQTNSQGVVFAIKSSHIFDAIEAARKNDASMDISMVSKNTLRGLDRSAQVRKIQDYIFMVKGN
jgi:S1-C subfamily serine protease